MAKVTAFVPFLPLQIS